MAAMMKYYIKPCIKKDDPDRTFWINVFRCLYFCNNANETDRMLLHIFTYARTKKDSNISRSADLTITRVTFISTVKDQRPPLSTSF